MCKNLRIFTHTTYLFTQLEMNGILISKLRPSYVPYNRVKLADDLLENVHLKVIDTIHNERHGKIDGALSIIIMTCLINLT